VKPLIGITVECEFEESNDRSNGKVSLNWNYAARIAEAGGSPILITPLTDLPGLAPLLDGWLIPGGADMDARHYGEANHPEAKLMSPLRWQMEDELFGLVNPQMPILGICYGCQFINVKRGGSLVQHLPDVVEHNEHVGGTLQTYSVDGSSTLYGQMKHQAIQGKSYHHQAVHRLGGGLSIVGRHSDGTVEAIEDATKPFFIGVQWHPERTPQDEASQNLFTAFISAARTYSEGKV
jgi:putative glutamine amidotransferase